MSALCQAGRDVGQYETTQGSMTAVKFHAELSIKLHSDAVYTAVCDRWELQRDAIRLPYSLLHVNRRARSICWCRQLLRVSLFLENESSGIYSL